MRPPTLAIALLNPDATPVCCGSTEESTAVVSGATAIAMPREMTIKAGNAVVQ